MRQRTLGVTGIETEESEETVEGALTGVTGIKSAVADSETGEVTVESEDGVDDQSIVDALSELGYELKD
ncbi:heavy-metal-associated domain-containing protein [Haloarcula litorea]|uniref:heavy-metal-associated domain-containing protein n=1 Tax=Haloarcula litorea TaxID=3032579 RepID=UPI0023E8AB64|nr:heavy metal-associated domain-containing protein [Halomicroarcula sp. GDY20]